MESISLVSGSFSDFSAAAREVLRLLHNRLGFDLWMVTRTEGDDWIVLNAEDHGYGVTDGTVFSWAILATELRVAEEARRAERAQAAALIDPLTGLYNRRGWDHLLAAEEERCRRYGHPACVASIDLNGLKSVNDTLGHAAGDELLRRCGEVLQSSLRHQDIAARLGGDEFAVLCVECDSSSIQNLIGRMRCAFAERAVAASVGFASRDPARGLVHALHRADEAMYAEKRLTAAAEIR